MTKKYIKQTLKREKISKKNFKKYIEDRTMVLIESNGNEYTVVDVRDLALICEYYHQSIL